MCGIGGYQIQKSVALDTSDWLTSLQNSQHHRGPDGKGCWTTMDNCTGLCHTRLAIVDLSPTGAQPMVSQDGKLTITCNGEIYNWKSLRRELEIQGAVFHTQSDTEVILAGYQLWGYEVLQRLRGMYSFALWDSDSDTLFCARDQIGKKPFVYAENENGFFFASEIPALKTIARSAKINLEIDESALANMLLHNLRHIPEPLTVYRGIRKLRPGHAIISKDGFVKKMWRHWEPSPNKVTNPEQLREILEEAVAVRSVADVPVGAFLSGGVDSTAIVHLMQQQNCEPVHTYAFGADKDDEDLRRARFVAQKIGTNHKEFYFDPTRQYEIFKTILDRYGEPIMLLPLIHAYQLSEAVYEDGIKVVLNGNGADELFYGYTGHILTARVTRLMNLFGGIRHILPKTRHPKLSVFLAPPAMRKATLYERKAEECWPTIFQEDVVASLENVVSNEMEAWGKLLPNKNFIDESNYLSLIIENTHSLTIASDLPGMMASIEMRSPFLDQKVISAAMGIHYSKKVQGPKDGSQLKQILRQAVSNLVPQEVLHASKRGFGMGVQERDVLSGPWKKQADDVFNNFPLSTLFDGSTIQKMWLDAKDSNAVNWELLSKLFAIGTWSNQ